MGSGAAGWRNTRRYPPPTRTSASQEIRDKPNDFGTHHCLSSSGLLHASNTRRAGPLIVRVTTSSRSDFRSTFVLFFMRVPCVSLPAFIELLLAFQCFDDIFQLVEPCVPELVVPLEPRRLVIQPPRTQLARPHATDLLCRDETGLFQDADVLLHAR